jgi:hypothetical protein
MDLDQLSRIPDPFADEAKSEPPAFDPKKLEPSPTRATVQGHRVTAGVIAALVPLAWLGIHGLRRDFCDLPMWLHGLGIAAPALLAAGVMLVALRPGQRGLGMKTQTIATMTLLAAGLFVALTVLTPDHAHRDTSTINCLLFTSIISSLPVVALIVGFRRSFAAASMWRTVALGVSCGAFAAAAMRSVCPNDNPWHVLAGHGAGILLGALIGASLSRLTRA